MDRQVVKWYTRARKFPQLIGRTHDGTRIPGGPYTTTQFIGAVLMVMVAVNTIGLWARFGLVGNIFVLGGVIFGGVWSLGKIPIGARNPVSVVFGLVRAVTRPGEGTVRGHRVRLPKPHQIRHRIITTPPVANRPTSRRQPPNAPEPIPERRPPATPLTGVQRTLLAARERRP